MPPFPPVIRLARIALAALVIIAPLAVTASAALAKDGVFIRPDQLDVAAILAPPPANDSETTRAELAELKRIQAARTPDLAARASADADGENVWLYRTVLGPAFTAEALPKVAAFFERVKTDEGAYTDPAKKIFNRPRPPVLDAEITPACKLTKSGSYPSGHTTAGYLMGVILAAMVPEKRAEILDRAADYGRMRLVCGVHYPSDVEAGRVAGTTMAVLILNNPEARKEMEPACAELRQALGLK